jgi:DNA gyrase subunit B
MHHGNLKVGLIDEDLLLSGDFMQLRRTAETLADLFGAGAYMMRGEKKQVVTNFGDAMKWLLNEVERGISKQRYKGLGEMNPSSCGKRRWTRRSAACCASRSTTPSLPTRFSRH